jgi:hypothetical protein
MGSGTSLHEWFDSELDVVHPFSVGSPHSDSETSAVHGSDAHDPLQFF